MASCHSYINARFGGAHIKTILSKYYFTCGLDLCSSVCATKGILTAWLLSLLLFMISLSI